MTEKDYTLHWYHYPDEKPSHNGWFLTKNWEHNSINGTYRAVFRNCLYVDDNDIKGFFYNGSEFWLKDFYFLDLKELE